MHINKASPHRPLTSLNYAKVSHTSGPRGLLDSYTFSPATYLWPTNTYPRTIAHTYVFLYSACLTLELESCFTIFYYYSGILKFKLHPFANST